jgi:alkylation response protein AidB-like acyl-CoA dehydrogenase
MFSLELKAEQKEIRETVRDFTRREIQPSALERDRIEEFDCCFPWEALAGCRASVPVNESGEWTESV